ncbi:flagellar biosynthesis regulatory protein FlaF [Iodidimonas gelatinilytica]|uniref:Flagellar biosynthesis regulatory protein FlaF n=1 Tax=Iodidimonas gelatinilytica TaxID=1236966 RepID=A0A5A7MLU2_9PROT|nr:flagellar biosynthesis regulator FlaF [Iodidimonas gelatinilytica]GEQ96951.1 flagellar biosynthesis regulatory protein FlaF [Iodidimonas gelatinilytica]GER00501.1 flagellar biosynthesis regulatory protein FlaF [Iodidimonas gelatinilytica]
MSLDAYHQRQVAAESPRQTEYRLFGRVTGALIDAKEQALKGAALMKALDWNRRLWSTLAADCSVDDNDLPQATRAQIISLSIYVSKSTSKVMRGEASIDDLIGINKIIMEGLALQVRNEREAAERAENQQAAPPPSLPLGGLVG